ncbi:hypothetical protein [Planotetraspora kaengkrachanensis]
MVDVMKGSAIAPSGPRKAHKDETVPDGINRVPVRVFQAGSVDGAEHGGRITTMPRSLTFYLFQSVVGRFEAADGLAFPAVRTFRRPEPASPIAIWSLRRHYSALLCTSSQYH